MVFGKFNMSLPKSDHSCVGLGASFKMLGWKHNFMMSGMLPYVTKDGDKEEIHTFSGFMGAPVVFEHSQMFKKADTKFECSAKAGAQIEIHTVISHDLSDNMELKHHQHFYGERVGSDKPMVDVGFELNYKL